MSDIAAMVKALIDAGTAPDVAAEIVARAFVAGAQRARPRKLPTDAPYTPDFEGWWKSYPRDDNMSKKEAFAEWLKLKPEHRAAAIAAMPAFNDYCRKHQDYRIIHACRYLKYRRFEGFAAFISGDPGVFVKPDDPRWWELSHRYKQEKHTSPPLDRNGGWRFPTAWLNGSH